MTEQQPTTARRLPKRALALAVAIAAVASALVFMSRSEGTPQRDKREALVPVKVAVAEQKAVPVQLQAVGTVEAFATVSIKSRIDGQLVGVHFREGQDVKKGDLLFTIDPRPYESAIKEARARLDRDAALAGKAELDAKRYAELVAKNFVSSDKFEQFRANAEALRATVAADRAALERAQLNLDYCFIRAPMTGRTGRLLVDQGAQIKANDDKGGMVEIMQIMPISVGFAVPQQHLAAIKTHMAAGPLKVEADIPESELKPEAGTLSFLDNKVNTQTGTVLLKGAFANQDRLLWPGQFVMATLTLTTRGDAVVIPSVAIQVGQDGQFVYVVKPDMTVESRTVAPGMSVGDGVVVDKGLAAGERVVTEGQLRLVPGAKVQISNS
ncbi:MAG: efflux RND transporter periplasmic adaptor subunit [Desulfobacterales bacterium]|jgi:multidrug efflux system membrane fusion protein|nr:efflux RND transporter periplasmic adaptor subunit [Desulfobacterales bacterium]